MLRLWLLLVGAGAQDWSVTTDVECMGPGPSSDPSYYTLHNPITAEQDCKDLCLADSACVGIEFSSMFMNCEVWTSPIDTTLPGVGYSCYVLLPSTTTSTASTSVTATSTATQTTSETSTQTSTLTSTSSSTLTFTSTWTFTSTLTLTNTQTATSTLTSSVTATLTTSLTATSTSTATSTATGTFTTTDTATTTATATVTATRTVTETSTATATATTTGTTAAATTAAATTVTTTTAAATAAAATTVTTTTAAATTAAATTVATTTPAATAEAATMVATTTAAATAVATTTAAAATTVAGTTAATAATTAASTVSVATLATSTTSSPAATGTSQSADARTATLCLQNGTDWQCQETTSESEVSLAERELELLRMLGDAAYVLRRESGEVMSAQRLAPGASNLTGRIFVPASFVSSLGSGALVSTALDPNKTYPSLSTAQHEGVAALLSIRAGDSLGFAEVKDLKEPILFALVVDVNREARCAYWDVEEQRWSDKGVETLGRDEEGRLLCSSTHLTLFAAIMGGFIEALLCSQATLLSEQGLRAILETEWYRRPNAKLLWIMMGLQSLLMALACICDLRRRRGGWSDENFVTSNRTMVKASVQFARTKQKTMIAGGKTKRITTKDLANMKEMVHEGCCGSLKETTMNFLDTVGSTCEASFSYVRNFLVCAWETTWELISPSEGNTRKGTLRRILARLVATSIEHQACTSLWRSKEDVRFLQEEHRMSATGSATPSTRAQSMASKAWSSVKFTGQESSVEERISYLHHIVEERLERQHQQLMETDGRAAFLAKTAGVLFLSQAPWLTVLQSSIFRSSSMGAVLLLSRITGALAVTALFWQSSAASNGSSAICRQDLDMWDSLGKCIAVALATVCLASIPEILLSKLHQREFVDCEDEERQLKKWRRKDRLLWFLCVSYIIFCLIFVASFLANVAAADARDWEITATIEILTELFLVPVFMTLLFLSVTAISTRWKEVIEESGEHIGCGLLDRQTSIIPSKSNRSLRQQRIHSERQRQLRQIQQQEVSLPGLLRSMDSDVQVKHAQSSNSDTFGKVLSCGA